MDTRLVIIDGNAILHRAFHALPPLTAPDGTQVNAVYGFMTMLVRIAHDLAPTHMAVTFDRPAPTFRKAIYEKYQIKRPKMDESLVVQIPIVHDLVLATGLPVFEADGFEADDVIATIVKSALDATDKSGDAMRVIIVTGDRDILQLVSDRVCTYMPTKGLSEAKIYGPDETKERMGVGPSQIPDYKALAGDQSDGYPGVDGVGPKTAAALLTTFTTVEELYCALETNDERISKISTGVKEKLIRGKEPAMLSKDLATIRDSAPVSFSLNDAHAWSFESEPVISLLTNLGFVSLVRRLQKIKNPVSSEKNKEKKRATKTKPPENQMELL